MSHESDFQYEEKHKLIYGALDYFRKHLEAAARESGEYQETATKVTPLLNDRQPELSVDAHHVVTICGDSDFLIPAILEAVTDVSIVCTKDKDSAIAFAGFVANAVMEYLFHDYDEISKGFNR